MSDLPLDPALELKLMSPSRYRLRRLLVVVPLVLWIVPAVAILVVWRDAHPPPPLLLGLLCSGIALIAFAVPLVARSLLEMVAWVRARAVMRKARAAIGARDGPTAETVLRPVLDAPRVLPFERALALHLLGLAALVGGEVPRARALLAHASGTGWLDALSLRPQRWAFAQARAVVATLDGDLDAAGAHLAEAERGAWLPHHRAYTGYARLLLAARGAHWSEVRALAAALDTARLPPRATALVRVLAARAAHHAGDPIDASALADWDPPKWVEPSWPELLEFVSEHARAPA